MGASSQPSPRQAGNGGLLKQVHRTLPATRIPNQVTQDWKCARQPWCTIRASRDERQTAWICTMAGLLHEKVCLYTSESVWISRHHTAAVSRNVPKSSGSGCDMWETIMDWAVQGRLSNPQVIACSPPYPAPPTHACPPCTRARGSVWTSSS